jgi:tRNA(Ser,Leu) C12 N-acetylase TAN1
MELIDIAQDYWIIISAFVGIVTSYVTLKMQNENQERRIAKLEEESEKLNPVLMEIRTKLASIEATLIMLCKENK